MFLFALSAFTANKFIDTPKPISGIHMAYALHREVDGKGRPASEVYVGTTDVNGKFSYKFDKAGKYDLQISYDEIIRKLNTMKTNKTAKNNYEITFTFTGSKGLTVNGDSVGKIKINKQTGIISLNVPDGGGSISGIIEWGDPHETTGDGFQ